MYVTIVKKKTKKETKIPAFCGYVVGKGKALQIAFSDS